MRALQALAVAAALCLASGAGVAARAAEVPLTRDTLVAALKSDSVWCSWWRDRDRSCEDVAYTDGIDGDQVSQVSRFRLWDDPDLQIVVRETRMLKDGALCSTFRFLDLEIAVLSDGVEAPTEQALPVLAMLAQSMADLEGKKTCEVFTRDEATGLLRSTATVDGEPAPEYDTEYRLTAPEIRIRLRPMIDSGETPSPV